MFNHGVKEQFKCNSPCTSVVLLLSASKTLEILPPNEMGEKVATQRRNRPPSQKKWLTSNSRKNRKDEYSRSNVFESNTTVFVILGATVAGVFLARYLISYPGTSLNSKATSDKNDVKRAGDKAETLNARGKSWLIMINLISIFHSIHLRDKAFKDFSFRTQNQM